MSLADKIDVTPIGLRFENHTSGSVIGSQIPSPRLSWKIESAPTEFKQSGYEVYIERQGSRRTFYVSAEEQVLVPWPDLPLRSHEIATVRVRVFDISGTFGLWSKEETYECGKLKVRDWKASFISPYLVGNTKLNAPIFCKEFHLNEKVSGARLYITSHGIYSAVINGKRVGKEYFNPGWTSYSTRLRYQTYDITELLKKGKNTVEITVGNGWYKGQLGYEGLSEIYGDELALLAQIEWTNKSGEAFNISTDRSWVVRESAITFDDIYDGQTTDLRLLQQRDKKSISVKCVQHDLSRLISPEGPAVSIIQELAVEKIWESPAGKLLVDFGQNLVGWVKLSVKGSHSGQTIIVRHAEVLENEELGVRPLRSAKATDTYILGDDASVVLQPEFTFHGFRYAEISGIEKEHIVDIQAVCLSSELSRTGWFDCSNSLVNRLHENVIWGMKGNFFDIPTDCPQRNERLGWTGDIQVFAPTASFLFEVNGFLNSWLSDLAAEQRPSGEVPHYVPCVSDKPFAFMPTAAWGDVAVVLPWTLYQRYGDSGVLHKQFDSMKSWVDCVLNLVDENLLWSGGFQFGDWLDPSAPPEDPGKSAASPDVVATAHLIRSLELFAESSKIIGKHDVSEKYQEIAFNVKDAFIRAFVTQEGYILSDCPTVYAIAIQWSLFKESKQKQFAGKRLADLVRISGFTISTGFVGTPLVCDALTSTGHEDVAYRLLLQTECPSWLYPVTMGATTIWERWDSMLPDGSINSGEMTSFNHYALGAVADWLHRVVGGIAPTLPGYKRFTVKPIPHSSLTYASASHESPYGKITVSWERNYEEFFLKLSVPVGTEAEVFLPGVSEAKTVRHGSYEWTVPCDLTKKSKLEHIRDILDEQSVWFEIVNIAKKHNVVLSEKAAANKVKYYLNHPSNMLGHAIGPDVYFPGVLSMRREIAELLNYEDPVVNIASSQRVKSS